MKANTRKDFRKFNKYLPALGVLLFAICGMLFLSRLISGVSPPFVSIAEAKTPVIDPLRSDLLDLVAQYVSEKVAVIDMSAITKFEWDEMSVIGPYMSSDELDKIIGNSWRQICPAYKAYDSDGYVLLVFLKNNLVVHCLDYPNYENYFFVPAQGYMTGIPIEKSLFILDEKNRIVWKYYE